MANLEKHKKKLVEEWLEGDENTAPTHSRGSHILGSYIKIPKAATRKFRPNLRNQTPAKPEVALAREPAPPPRLQEKHSQAASFEHLRKLERLPQLRAPYQYKNR